MNSAECFEFLKQSLHYEPVVNAAMLNVHRTLEKVYPNDLNYKLYKERFAKDGEGFYDFFHLLWHIGSIINPKNIMEIGSRSGTSIIQLLSAMPNLDGKRVVIFDFPIETLSETDKTLCNEAMIRANFRYLNLPTDIVEFVYGRSQETVPTWREENPDFKFDYILVDGGHAYDDEKIDMENSAKMLAPGGILLMDDLTAPPLHALWNEFKAEKGEEFLFCENFVWKGVGVAVKK